jgi:acyl carrier protein
MDEIKQTIKNFIRDEFLAGEDAQSLSDTTPLISSRILDSIATLRVVEFLRERYAVEVRPEQMTEEYLGTVADIARLVEANQ